VADLRHDYQWRGKSGLHGTELPLAVEHGRAEYVPGTGSVQHQPEHCEVVPHHGTLPLAVPHGVLQPAEPLQLLRAIWRQRGCFDLHSRSGFRPDRQAWTESSAWHSERTPVYPDGAEADLLA